MCLVSFIHYTRTHAHTQQVTVTYSDGRQTRTDVHRTDRDGTSSLRRRTEWGQGDSVQEGNYLHRLKDWLWPRK